MAWSGLIRRRHPDERATAAETAASLAEAIIRNTNSLQARIEAEGFARIDPARATSDECLLECLIFEWFLRHVMASPGLAGGTKAISRALAGRLLIDLQRSGLSVPGLDNFDQRQRDRFEEYAEALDVSSSLQPLGALAWRRISGDGQPSERMTMLLAVRARTELSQSVELK